MNEMVSEPITYCAGWTLVRIDECDSTNDFARDMDLWTAVEASRQRKGRGRYNRSWLSDEGGAWFSAVVPAPLSDDMSRLTPLAAGLAVADTLVSYGVGPVRFRWPNDVMVQDKKCAGILVDRFRSDRCVVGIGVNVWNDPAEAATELAGTVTRLRDWMAGEPDVTDVTIRILVNLKKIILAVHEKGPEYLIGQLKPYWNVGRRVEIERCGQKESFVFEGVDAGGRVLVSDGKQTRMSFGAEEITLFREL